MNMRTTVLIGLGLLSSSLLAAEVQPVAVKALRLVLPTDANAVVENTGKVFSRQIQQRCEAKVVMRYPRHVRRRASRCGIRI